MPRFFPRAGQLLAIVAATIVSLSLPGGAVPGWAQPGENHATASQTEGDGAEGEQPGSGDQQAPDSGDPQQPESDQPPDAGDQPPPQSGDQPPTGSEEGADAPARGEGGREPDQVGDNYIVVYRKSVDSPKEKTEELEEEEDFDADLQYRRALKGFAAELSEDQVDEIEQDPEVAFVTPDRPVEALGSVPLASGDTTPTGVRRMGAATVTTTRPASNATVAVIDTGIDLDHPDLNAANGKNCVGSGAADDDAGHGTHVAGTIAARNNGAGVVGVAPGTKLQAVKVLDSSGSGSWSQVICGIDWVTATRQDGDSSNDVDVANMSLGGVGDPVESCSQTTDALHRAICNSTAAGVTYVVAAGNSAWDFDYGPAPDVPAAYPEVLTVTAMSDGDGGPGGTGGHPGCDSSEDDDRYATFSNFALTSGGAQHAIAGPGVCIRSTYRGGGYATMSGTSMATPHLAGTVALCLDEGGVDGPCQGLSPSGIVAKVRSEAQAHTNADSSFGFSGDPTRPAGDRYFGYLAWAGAAGSDETAPSVSSVSPGDGATGVPTSSTVSVTFSEPMDTQATQAAFSLSRSSTGAAVAGSFSWSGNTMTFRPSSALEQGVDYQAKVSNAAKDASGNALAAERAWTFRTVSQGSLAPLATTIISGSRRSGSFSDLATDNSVYYRVNSTTSGTRVTAWYASFRGVPRTPTALTFTYRGLNSRNCTQTISIWDWTANGGAGGWVTLDSRSVGTTETGVQSQPSGTLSRFVGGASGDEVRLRVRCTRSSRNFYASGELLKLSYTG